MKTNILAFKVSNTNDCNDEAPTSAYIKPTDEFFAKMEEFVDLFNSVSHDSLYSMELFYSDLDFVNVCYKDGIPNLDTHNIYCVDEGFWDLQNAILQDSSYEYKDDLLSIVPVRVSGGCAVITTDGIKFIALDKYSGEEYSTDFITIKQMKSALNDKNCLLTKD